MMSNAQTPLTRRAAAQARRRARRRSLVISTALLVGSTFLGISATGATYALLTAGAKTPTVKVSAGTSGLTVQGQSTYALEAYTLVPSKPVAKAFTVQNTGDVAQNVGATVSPIAGSDIANYANARLTRVSSTAECVPGVVNPTSTDVRPLSGFTKPSTDSMLKNTEMIYCFEIGLAANTPVALAGKSFDFTMTVNGVQDGSR